MDKKQRILYKIRMNPDTGEWERYEDETVTNLYLTAMNRLDEVRATYIEEALDRSDYKEANEIISWVKQLDRNTD